MTDKIRRAADAAHRLVEAVDEAWLYRHAARDDSQPALPGPRDSVVATTLQRFVPDPEIHVLIEDRTAEREWILSSEFEPVRP
ncbi:hypothetical protein [Haloarcula pellucida]|uniref:Uncharacterized protein n=1 Tax=Haloarcula pellucida TaxID=1427151 RepID=A0A830GQB7_9EURY|nr:hypothetical protein [Halomicroarcula pellucida]MBX0350492.1 hypothetical protein [Halomicroarcula pellucida]GGO03561.1 hypothetical protein GCM10009030_39370 [Halomicroarcula pellucida]